MAARNSPVLLFWVAQPMLHAAFGMERGHGALGSAMMWAVQPVFYAVAVGDRVNPALHPLVPVHTIVGFGWPFLLNMMF
eukprot:gene44323-38070_t